VESRLAGEEENKHAPHPVHFMEKQGASVSLCVLLAYYLCGFLLFAHDPVSGSYWCPLFDCEQMNRTNSELLTQSRYFALFCAVLDIGVLGYFAVAPPHPKFVMLRKRRIGIYVHVLAGSAQVVLGIVAYILYKIGYESACGVIWWIITAIVFVFHLPTASSQAINAFGEVRLMIPAYFFMVFSMAYVTIRVVKSGPTEETMMYWWAVLHVYAFNRLIFSILSYLNILANVRYTLSILIGAGMCLPLGLGPQAINFLFGGVLVFNVAYLTLMSDEDRLHGAGSIRVAGGKAKVKKAFVIEEGMLYAAHLPSHVLAQKKSASVGTGTGTDLESNGVGNGSVDGEVAVAHAVFDQLDTDASGALNLVPGTALSVYPMRCETRSTCFLSLSLALALGLALAG